VAYRGVVRKGWREHSERRHRWIGHSLNPKLLEVGCFHYISPFREMLMRNAVIFFVLLLWPLSLPTAASAGPRSLYGPFDQKHYGVRSEPASSAKHGALFGCGRCRYIAKGRLSWRPPYAAAARLVCPRCDGPTSSDFPLRPIGGIMGHARPHPPA
jgi:hypothetical protein